MRLSRVILTSMLLLVSGCSNQEPRESSSRFTGVAADAPMESPSASRNDRSTMIKVEDRADAAAAKTSPEKVAPPAVASQGAKVESQPYSTLDGSTITLHPSGFTFDLPAAWLRSSTPKSSKITIDENTTPADLERQLGRRNNKHLSRVQLSRIEKPDFDEWDREFGRACNAALPFDRCAAHVGSEGWGDDALRFDDLQLRVYDVPRTTSQIEDRIAQDAMAAVRTDQVRRETNGSWRPIRITYDRRHFDYGATAHIDIILTSAGARTLAFVFMYTSALKEPDPISDDLEIRAPRFIIRVDRSRGLHGGSKPLSEVDRCSLHAVIGRRRRPRGVTQELCELWSV